MTSAEELRRAVFVDRDGTLNRMVYDETHGILDSPFRVEDVVLRDGAAELLRVAAEHGLPRIVVTNQPGFAKGTLTDERLNAIHARLAELLAAEGAGFDDVLFCPHHPSEAAPGRENYRQVCDCRKPAPGMLLAGADRHRIALDRSWMIGDGLNDVQAGRAAGVLTILVTRLKPEVLERFEEWPECRPDHIASDMHAAARILADALTNDD